MRTKFEIRFADCVEGMSSMRAGSVDVVVTSPPYNLGTRYGRYNDHQEPQAYLDWTNRWTQQVHRVLRDDGSFFLNVGQNLQTLSCHMRLSWNCAASSPCKIRFTG